MADRVSTHQSEYSVQNARGECSPTSDAGYQIWVCEGQSISPQYKETNQNGVAIGVIHCKIIFGKDRPWFFSAK
jgi:hypothetical protein